MLDQILISQLAITTSIGITEQERTHPQKLRVSLTLTPKQDFTNIGDTLRETIDYAEVSESIKTLAASGSRQLIETLANEIASFLLATYPIASAEIEVRKYILPDTDFVAVRIHRKSEE